MAFRLADGSCCCCLPLHLHLLLLLLLVYLLPAVMCDKR
jgi:hypothetical protein